MAARGGGGASLFAKERRVTTKKGAQAPPSSPPAHATEIENTIIDAFFIFNGRADGTDAAITQIPDLRRCDAAALRRCHGFPRHSCSRERGPLFFFSFPSLCFFACQKRTRDNVTARLNATQDLRAGAPARIWRRCWSAVRDEVCVFAL